MPCAFFRRPTSQATRARSFSSLTRTSSIRSMSCLKSSSDDMSLRARAFQPAHASFHPLDQIARLAELCHERHERAANHRGFRVLAHFGDVFRSRDAEAE